MALVCPKTDGAASAAIHLHGTCSDGMAGLNQSAECKSTKNDTIVIVFIDRFL
jgi:hypothetical protein